MTQYHWRPRSIIASDFKSTNVYMRVEEQHWREKI